MKRLLLLLLLVLFCASARAQEEIIITNDGISPVVVMAEGQTAQQIYTKAKTAVLRMVEKPEKAILADQEGILLRFRTNRVMEFSGSMGRKFPFEFTCEIEFKEGKYRISFSDIAVKTTILSSHDSFFNNKGELRKQGYYSDSHKKFTNLLNEVHGSIKASVLQLPSTKGEW